MTPSQAGAELRREARKILEQAERADMRTLRAAMTEAVRMSSGSRSTQELQKIRPGAYAVSRGEPLFDPAVINAQNEGGFREHWRIDPKRTDNDTAALVNDSDVADFMKGTSKMVERPIQKHLEEFIEKIRMSNLVRGLSKYL